MGLQSDLLGAHAMGVRNVLLTTGDPAPQTAYVDAARSQDERWMNALREKAGLKSDWVPPDEQKKEDARS